MARAKHDEANAKKQGEAARKKMNLQKKTLEVAAGETTCVVNRAVRAWHI